MKSTNQILLVSVILTFGIAAKAGDAQPGRPSPGNVALAGADVQEQARAQVAVGLVDGTKIIGRIARRVFPVQTPYMKTDVPVALIAFIEREAPGGPFTIHFSNGDRIQGDLSFDALDLETLLGSVSIPIEKVTSLTILRDAPGATEGLAAYYPLKGNADDRSGHNNNGVSHGSSLTSDHRGLPNSAYFFSGSAGYVQIPDAMFNPSVRGFTICAWVLAGDISNRGTAVYTGTRMGECILEVDRGNFYFLSKLADRNWYMAAAPATRGTYAHLVGVYQRGRRIQLWINGERRSETPVPEMDLYGGPPATSAAIGAYWPENINFVWRGSIDNVRIYDRPLEEREIQSLYAAEK